MRHGLSLVAVFLLVGCGGGSNGKDVVVDVEGDGLADVGADSVAGDVGGADADAAGVDQAGDIGVGHDLEVVDTTPDPWTDLPFEATTGYLDRKAQYLQLCSDAGAPPGTGLYAQTCRVATGQGEYSVAAFQTASEKVTARKDTADFSVAALVRTLYLDRNGGSPLPDEIRELVETTLLGFRYWFSEPGNDKMCYWTENHQILFHSGELLAGQLFREEVFANSGMTGQQHIDHAEPLILRWLDFRARFGFSEWHSNVYFNEDMPALINLIDFAENDEIRRKAAIVLDIMFVDILTNSYKGLFATTHGRTYSGHFLDGLDDSTQEAAWIVLGIASPKEHGNFTACFLATSDNYVPGPLLEQFAEVSSAQYEHRQRDSIWVSDGPAEGLTYTETSDVVFWAGMSAIAAPQVINGLAAMLEEYNLWDGFLIGDLPEEYRSMLKSLAGTEGLESLAKDLSAISQGIALESVNTYTWRTEHYQMSGAQDHKPGFWGAQTQMWQATVDGDVFVTTSFPGNMGAMETGQEFGDPWIGGWFPRVTLHENVAIVQYRPGAGGGLIDEYLTGEYLHAYFPKDRFDEVVEQGNWVFGRKGDAYVALGSANPVRWSEEVAYELICDDLTNTWVVELGSVDQWEDLNAFVTDVTGAELSFGDKVEYDSPSVGRFVAGWSGDVTIEGAKLELGPYKRFDNAHVTQEFGSKETVILIGDKRLVLDFENGARHYQQLTGE